MKQIFEKMEKERIQAEQDLLERYMNIDADEGKVFENINAIAVQENYGTNATTTKQATTTEFTGETNFYVREQYVLAHSNNVDIVSNTNFIGHQLLKGLKFYKVITKRQMP